MTRFRSMTRRQRAAAALLLCVLFGVGVYVGAGVIAYQDLSAVRAHCAGTTHASDTPADFTINDGAASPQPDVAPYRFTDATEVSFPARGDDLTIRAWYAPPREPGGPVVILVHGFNACRRDWNVLLPAGMLHRAGFGVLLPDLRNHGESDSDGGRWAGGAKEYRDVLGAWDWLVEEGVPPSRIGIFGMSLGAATVVIATGEEPRVAATWADSSYASFAIAAAEYAEQRGYPGWVADPAVLIGRRLGDPELAVRDPSEELAHLAGRPLFIVQGTADTIVLPHNATDLAADAMAGGTAVEPWLVSGAGHTESMLLAMDAYRDRLIAFFSGAIGGP